MRLLLWILLAIICVIMLAACGPNPALAEGTLHPRTSSPSLQNYRSDCRPGRDPADPNCCSDTLAICRIICKDDYAENGDMLYLKHCERECEAEWKRCREGK